MLKTVTNIFGSRSNLAIIQLDKYISLVLLRWLESPLIWAVCAYKRLARKGRPKEPSTAWRVDVSSSLAVLLAMCLGEVEQTFDEVVVGPGPAVSVVGGEDPDGLFVCLEGGVPDLLQLDEDLISDEGAPITIVNVQLKELRMGRRKNEERHNERRLNQPG